MTCFSQESMFKRAFLSFSAAFFASFVLAIPAPLMAQESGPLRITITDGVIEPMPFAVPDFIAENGTAADYGAKIARVVASDLQGTGLFRELPKAAFIANVTNFNSPVQYADWKAINAQALVTGAVGLSGGRLTVKFRLYDVFSGVPMGKGLQFSGTAKSWRRMGHKVADAVYSRITGEGPYFDTRVAFIAESGPKNARRKRLALMDYDGANVQYLTDGRALVLSPRFSPVGNRLLYTSFASGFPRVTLLNLANGRRRILDNQPGTMSFAPRFSPDGKTVLLSLSTGGNTDIFRLDLASGRRTQLTSAPSIEIAPSYSPDGRRIVFTSDRSGISQLYIMAQNGGPAQRVSAGNGRYNTPVWSPRGDLIAFTKQQGGRFHIGVMRVDGTEERLLTSSFLDEGPSWSPNGRVIMFSRETPGANGSSGLYSVDISGRNLKRVPTDGGASDPAWSPEQK